MTKNSPMTLIKPWLSIKETAVYLGTTEGAIRNQIWRGQLKSYKHLGRTLLKRSEIDLLIEASAKGGFYGN